MLQALHGKQGRNYASKEERDEALTAEVRQLRETLHKQQDTLKTLQSEAAQLSSSCMDRSQEIGNQQANIQHRQESLVRCDR